MTDALPDREPEDLDDLDTRARRTDDLDEELDREPISADEDDWPDQPEGFRER
ncbi:MAG TPA: hypothetical protein VI076_09020 [Actinopolymorphaceae bacterium]